MEYSVVRRKLKHARINVNESLEVKLIIPIHFSEAEIIDLVEMKKDWIEQKVSYFKNQKHCTFSLASNEIMYLGNPIPQPSLEVLTWYKKQASKYIKDRVVVLSSLHKCVYNKIYIRDTKSKWGSCSTAMNLSFNWRLILTPPEIIDYIIIHELCHTKVLKHTNAFWLRVHSMCPDYLGHSAWLQENGKSIFDLAATFDKKSSDNQHVK